MKKLLSLIAALVCLTAAGAGVYWSTASAGVPVTLAEVKLSEVEPAIDTNGKIEAERIFELRAPFAGVCRRIFVAQGDRLKAGQPVLVIDDAPLKAELSAATAEREAAQTELRNVKRGAPPEELNQAEADVARYQFELATARKTLETNEWLVKREAISRWDVDQSRNETARLKLLFDSAVVRRDDIKNRFGGADLRRAAARVDAASSRVTLLQANIAKSTIRAPSNGTLYYFELRDGAFVNTGDLLGNLADLGRLRLRAFVDEPELGRVSPDSVVTVQWDGRPGQSWKASVIRIPSQVVPRGTRSVGEVLCTVEDVAGALVPNLNVDVEIRKQAGVPVAALPRQAVLHDGEGAYVWVLREGRAATMRVGTGKSTSRLMEITAGLTPGDRVLVPGDTPLHEGVKTRVVQ